MNNLIHNEMTIISNYSVERRGYGRFAVMNRTTHKLFFIEAWEYDTWRDLMDEDCGYLAHTSESEEYLQNLETVKYEAK